LRIHEGCPSQTQVIRLSYASLGENAPQFPDAVVESVNMSHAENCLVLVREPYEFVGFLSPQCQRFLDEYMLAIPKESGGYFEVGAVWGADVDTCYRGVCCESVVVCSIVEARAEFFSALGE